MTAEVAEECGSCIECGLPLPDLATAATCRVCRVPLCRSPAVPRVPSEVCHVSPCSAACLATEHHLVECPALASLHLTLDTPTRLHHLCLVAGVLRCHVYCTVQY